MNAKFKYSSYLSMKAKELEWICSFLSKFPEKTRILDAGCGDLRLIKKLRNMGFETWALDILDLSDKNFVREDMRKTSFKDKFFDVILCVNTLENVGMGDYGERIEYDGDLKAVQEFKRILRDDGILIIMVAFGEPCLKSRTHRFRVYDEVGLKKLIQKMKIVESHYYYFNVKTEDWRETIYPEEVKTVFTKETHDWMGNLILVLKKK